MRPEERTEARARWAAGFAVHVGVDAGKLAHQWVSCGPERVRGAAERVPVSRAGFEAAVARLLERHPGVGPAQVLVGIEYGGHHGQTFAAFLRAWGATLVTVSAVVTKRLKEVEDNSPRKDDAKDAGQVCRLVGQGLFVETAVLSPLVASLRVLTMERHRLMVEQIRLANRLQSALDLAWPEFGTTFPRLAQKTPRAVLAQWPLAADGASAPFRALSRVLREVSQGHHKADDARALQAAARASIALTQGVEARRADIRRMLARFELVLTQVVEVESTIEAHVAQHPGARALTTVPQVGPLCAGTLIAELGTPEGFADPRQVLKLAGMNLARRTSGTSLQGRVRQTKRGRPLLRRQLFLLAGRWCQPDGLLRADYDAMVQRNGGRKVAAICAMARRLVPLLLHVAQSGEAWDEGRWRPGRHAGASIGHAA
jgi:transposase